VKCAAVLKLLLCVATLASVASCAGDGTKIPVLDDGEPNGPFPPRLSSIQKNLLTPTCSPGCHEPGGIAPFSMKSIADSYANLVGVPNTELVMDSKGRLLLRVNPGFPSSSYMILKLEGAPGIIGDRMPQGRAPLDRATIDTIAEWIAQGAPND